MSKRTPLFLTLALFACARSDVPPEVTVQRGLAGDTIVLTSSGQPTVITIDDVDVVWQDDRLENPGSMALTGERLLIGDRTNAHVLDLAERRLQTLGREGEGPAEFRTVRSVGFAGRDTIVVYDSRLMRLSYFSIDGEYLRMRRVAPVSPYVNPPRDGPPLVLHGSSILWTRSENVHIDRPTRIALVWHDLEADTATVIRAWDDVQWRDLGSGFIGLTHLFPSRALIAIAEDGRIASGDGLDYCVTVWRVAEGEDVTRFCRNRERARVGSGIRSPDPNLVPEDQRELLEEIWATQEVGDRLPSYDLLRFSRAGELWVRTLGTELSEVHPHILSRNPDLRPSHRAWDVFSLGGDLEGTVRLPTSFDPRVIDAGRIYGFLELPTGEITIGGVELPVLDEIALPPDSL